MDLLDTPVFLFCLSLAVALGSWYIWRDAVRDIERQRLR